MKLNLPNAVTTRLGRVALISQKNSPKILFAGGIVLMGATIVSSCKATLELGDTLDEIREERKGIDIVVNSKPGKYTEKEISRLNNMVTVKGLAQIAKLYLPSIALGVAAVACLTTSHNQLTRRNAGLSAALAATERALDSYRSRVREAYGEDRERELWRDEKTESVPVIDDEGRETKSTKKVKRGGGYSPYACLWGRETSGEWSPDSPYNLAKLRSVQEWGTMEINSKGHLFLNDIRRELGLPDISAGQVVGWRSLKYGGTDGYVDFGIFKEGEEVRFVDFLNGDEEHIWLDFNVDGEIWRSI